MLPSYHIFIALLLLILGFQPVFAAPSCPANKIHELGLNLTIYNTYQDLSFPRNHAQYDTFISKYATPARKFNSGSISAINGSGNPYGPNEYYLSIFTGFIEAPVTGIYGIGIDGDDAVEVIIDGNVVTGWYGGHGRRGSAQYIVNINLTAGYHTLEYRHQERSGGDNYYLYWKKPNDAQFSIVSATNLSSCQDPLIFQPAVTPMCTSPIPQLKLSTYNTDGYNIHPVDHNQYNTLVNNYAIPTKLFNFGTVSTINGVGNPYGVDSKYLSIFKGYLYAPINGIYQVGLDGDDAIEVIIDGNVISSWYGGHGKAGSAQNISYVALDAGYHDLVFRHEELSGGDSYYLYWQPPSSTSLGIISAASLFHCPDSAYISLTKTSETYHDPFNLFNKPKAIPGATIKYILTAHNSGSLPSTNNKIEDSLDNLITNKGIVSWLANSITVQTPSLYGGVERILTDISDSDAGSFNDTAGNRVVSVNCGVLSTNQSCIVTYQVLIE